MRKFVAALLFGILLFSGCTAVDLSTGGPPTTATGGLVSGPPTSGGQQIVLSVTGASLSKFWNERASRTIDRRDREHVGLASDRSLRSGEPQEWKNRETGNHGRVSPGQTYRRAGRLCRDFTHTFWRDSEKRSADGTACQLENGAWEVIG